MVPYLEAIYHVLTYQGNRISRIANQMHKGICTRDFFRALQQLLVSRAWSVYYGRG